MDLREGVNNSGRLLGCQTDKSRFQKTNEELRPGRSSWPGTKRQELGHWEWVTQAPPLPPPSYSQGKSNQRTFQNMPQGRPRMFACSGAGNFCIEPAGFPSQEQLAGFLPTREHWLSTTSVHPWVPTKWLQAFPAANPSRATSLHSH